MSKSTVYNSYLSLIMYVDVCEYDKCKRVADVFHRAECLQRFNCSLICALDSCTVRMGMCVQM